MADTAVCFSLIRGRAMRATRLDGCGRPIVGPCASIVTDGFISVAFSAQTETGDAISVTNAAGQICVSDTPAPQFTGYTVEIQFCNVNPELLALITGMPSVFDAVSGLAAGFRVNSDIRVTDLGFALELWSSVPQVACSDENAQGSFGYLLLPFLQGGVLGDFTIENAAVTFTVTGSATKTGSGWGVGPFNVVADDEGDPGPLAEAIESGDHLHVQVTSVAPPEPACECLPNGLRATTGTAGIPGTYSPTDSYAPTNFADLTAHTITASPNTAWTTGQYIELLDGSHAHWSGSAWVAGNA